MIVNRLELKLMTVRKSAAKKPFYYLERLDQSLEGDHEDDGYLDASYYKYQTEDFFLPSLTTF